MPTTIRVLVLKPGSSSDPLTGDLQHIELGSAEDAIEDTRKPTELPDDSIYEALSYVWGKGKFVQSIELPGGSLPLMANLRKALLRFRLRDRPRVLWIDGICINQEDMKERSSQVKMMGEIYKKARQVLVWLGPDTNQIARKTFKQIGTKIELATGIENGDKESLEIMKTLSQCEWFSRLWVVQELILARQAIACWGQEEVEFDDLYFPMYVYHTTTGLGGTLWAGRIFASLDDHGVFVGIVHKADQAAHRQAREYDFLELLEWTSSLHCADDHDRIYALLGLRMTEKSPLHNKIKMIQPDYEKPVEDLFFDMASLCIESEQLHDFLASVHHSADITTPSWIPKWGPGSSSRSKPLPSLCCMSDSLSPPLQKPTTDAATHSLSLSGFAVDTITAAFDPLEPDISMLQSFNLASDFHSRHVMLSRFDIPDERRPLLDLCFLETLSHGIVQTKFKDEDTLTIALFHINGPEEKTLEAMRDRVNNKVMMQFMYAAMKPSSGVNRHRSHATGGYGGFYAPESPWPIWAGRRLFATSSGFFGLGPGAMRPGDQIVSFSGVNLPCVVRRVNDFYYYVGTACIPLIYYEDGMRVWRARCGDPEIFELR